MFLVSQREKGIASGGRMRAAIVCAISPSADGCSSCSAVT
jgi:hypothetical protein